MRTTSLYTNASRQLWHLSQHLATPNAQTSPALQSCQFPLRQKHNVKSVELLRTTPYCKLPSSQTYVFKLPSSTANCIFEGPRTAGQFLERRRTSCYYNYSVSCRCRCRALHNLPTAFIYGQWRVIHRESRLTEHPLLHARCTFVVWEVYRF
jgi:hypothetical protein